MSEAQQPAPNAEGDKISDEVCPRCLQGHLYVVRYEWWDWLPMLLKRRPHHCSYCDSRTYQKLKRIINEST
jgi:hypothetical protein